MKRAKTEYLLLLAAVLVVGSSATAGDSSYGANSPIRLTDVASQAGVTLLNISGNRTKDYILEVNGNGAAFFDYDADGDMDLLLINGSTLADLRSGGSRMVTLYENDGNASFADVTNESGLAKNGWGMGVCVADYDNDGYRDVYVTAYGSNILFRNNGNRTFSDVTSHAGIGDSSWSAGCAFGDYDRDGYVDLYVANYLDFDVESVPKRGGSEFCRYMDTDVICGPRGLRAQPDRLYRNKGDGTFTNVTEVAGIQGEAYYGFGVIFSDVNNDGWTDIFVANDSTPNFLFLNNKDGTFSEVGLIAGVALSEEGREQAGMGVDIGDYNNDGEFDIFVTNFSHDSNTLSRNEGNGMFSDRTYVAGLGASSLAYLGWGAGFVDLDNDGLLDIFVANGHVYPEIDQLATGSPFLQPNQVYKNLGNERFEEIIERTDGLAIERSSRGTAFGDYDNDGDIDILVVNLNDRPTLLRNDSANGNHWLTLRLIGRDSNRDAIGTRVTIQVGELLQTSEVRSGGSYLSHNDFRIHFGLNGANRVDRLELRWPSGLVETFADLPVDRMLVITEGVGLGPLEDPKFEGD